MMTPLPSAQAAARAVNALGIDLLRAARAMDTNALWSPYSIQTVMAMAYAGAGGETRAEMARVLRYPPADDVLHDSFTALRDALADVVQRSIRAAEEMAGWGQPCEPISLIMANRLFGQSGYEFREAFLALIRDRYGTPFGPVDFAREAAEARQRINRWVEGETRARIRELVPENALGPLTRLILVNAIYLKAPWAEEFDASDTEPRPFYVRGAAAEDVPTMRTQRGLGYARRDGCDVVSIPYRGWDLQFLLLLPDEMDGLRGVEAGLDSRAWEDFADLSAREVVLYLPKFKLEPPVATLSRTLQALGMRSAFDEPRGSANFERLAPKRGADYLCLSEVYHKTFLNLDEKGTEAAAATALTAAPACAPGEPPKPLEIRVDHPFVLAIQHRESGACLFLGHVVDPR